ncbi:MAG: hypothetical protein ACETVZ_06580 [Phycisphaerae bacterium]
MKAIALLLQIFFFISLLGQAGCKKPADSSIRTEPSPKADSDFYVSIYALYAPVKIDIMPLTEFVSRGDAKGTSKRSRKTRSQINVYVSLLDSFGSQKKSPGVFRFEMYEYVQRSAEPKGGRIAIWPDTDLTDAAENNKYWRDFLRAYQFNLPFELAVNQSYILQVTFLCPTGKRLSDEFVFTQPK